MNMNMFAFFGSLDAWRFGSASLRFMDGSRGKAPETIGINKKPKAGRRWKVGARFFKKNNEKE